MGPRVGKISALLGTPFMPWQQQVVDVGLEIDPATGLLAYREVVVTVMRQSGKSVLVLAGEVDRCVSWDTPQRVAYTAQTGWDARKKLIDDHAPVVVGCPLNGLVDRVLRGAGNEGIVWKDGSRIDVMASTASAGHGRTLDMGVIDEAFDDQDDRREQAILPAMATRPDAQLWVVSTAGTSKSTYLRRKVETGRHAAEQDAGSGVAYFEWSIPDDADVDDPEVWWEYMPAMGRTISPAAVHHARQTMSDSEFRRGFGNQWTDAEHDRLLPEALWKMCGDPKAAPSGDVTFGLDVMPDRTSGSIAASGGGVVELIANEPGTGWMVDRARQIHERWGGTFRIDAGGPATSVADDLEAEGVPVDRLAPVQVAAACARLFDSVADGNIRVRSCPELDRAAGAVEKRPVGDRFVWSRSTSTADITPLYAVTLAWDGSSNSYDVLDSVW